MSDIDVFINMNKNKKITIRLTESQMIALTSKIIEEETTKSNLLREMIQRTVQTCRNNLLDGKKQ